MIEVIEFKNAKSTASRKNFHSLFMKLNATIVLIISVSLFGKAQAGTNHLHLEQTAAEGNSKLRSETQTGAEKFFRDLAAVNK